MEKRYLRARDILLQSLEGRFDLYPVAEYLANFPENLTPRR